MTNQSGISLAASVLERSDASIQMFNLGLKASDALEECHSVVDLLQDVEGLHDAFLVRRHDFGDDIDQCSPTHIASISRADRICNLNHDGRLFGGHVNGDANGHPRSDA